MRTKAKWMVGMGCSMLLAGSAMAAAPNVPLKVSPINGATTNGNPVLDWNAATGATWYRVWLAAESNVTVNLLKEGHWIEGNGNTSVAVNGTTLVSGSSLPPGNYQWWVRSWNNSGQSPWGNNAGTFTVAAATPLKVISIPPQAYSATVAGNYQPAYNGGFVSGDPLAVLAPVQIPHGATVYEIICYYQELTSSTDFYLNVRGSDGSSIINGYIDSAPSTASPGSVSLSNLNGIFVVDNENESINISIYPGDGSILQNIVIKYRE